MEEISIVDLTDEIELLINEKPDRRKKELYKNWLKDINEKITNVNKLANYNIYGNIK